MEFARKLIADYWLPIHPRLRKAIVFVFVALIMLCVALGSLASKPQRVQSEADSATVENAGLTASGTTNSDSPNADSISSIGTIYVHLVGAIRHPGVYELTTGSRVMDAVLAADGFAKNADQASINLARVLTDGEQLVILRLGEAASSLASASGEVAKVNLNQASSTELETLPGIGPTLAARIIDWRLANGGFKKLSDLRKIAGIGAKLYEKLKPAATL